VVHDHRADAALLPELSDQRLDNISFRNEYVNDVNGQRTAPPPAISAWRSASSIGSRRRSNSVRNWPTTIRSTPRRFNSTPSYGTVPTSKNALIGSADIIWAFLIAPLSSPGSPGDAPIQTAQGVPWRFFYDRMRSANGL